MIIEDFKNKIIQGSCIKVLKEIPDESVDMIITSPPYWGLRRYGDYKEQIGLEPTFSEYLDKIMAIMKEIKRVVKKEGQIWINIGDCYASNGSEETRFWHENNTVKHKPSNDNYAGRARCKNYQPKCLLMMPERFAIRCIDELGLILRNKIKWTKQVLIKKENRTIGSVMPASVKDRFNESGEELYFFVKNKKYYSDLDAVRLPNQVIGVTDFRDEGILRQRMYPESKYNKNQDYKPSNFVNSRMYSNSKFNKDCAKSRDWKHEYQGKFAGKSDAEMFGSPRARTQRGLKSLAERMDDTKNKDQKSSRSYNLKKLLSEVRLGIKPNIGMIPNKVNDPRGNHEGGPGGWRDFINENHRSNYPLGKNLPTVWQIQSEPHNFQKELNVNTDHFAIFPQALVEIPIKFGCPPNGIVLDPFIGSGTTAIMAKKLGRNYIGIELNHQYIEIAEERIKKECPNNLFENENN